MFLKYYLCTLPREVLADLRMFYRLNRRRGIPRWRSFKYAVRLTFR